MICTILLSALAASAGFPKTGVILDSHPEWIELRNRALGYARAHQEKLDGWETQLCCIPKVGIIWQWDSCYMALYAGYTPDGLNALGNLENLYRMQSPDGYVSMAYNYADRQPTYGERINPPLYAWVEWLYARRTGDLSRLPRAYAAASKLWRWTKEHRRRVENDLYWFEDTGSSGMDNSPRSGYQAYDLKGSDVCFVDLCCQQVLAARCLAKIAPLVGKADETAGWTKEADELAKLINEKMWCEKTGFYHDVWVRTCNKVANKTAAAFWAIVSGVADGAQVAKLAAHLTNPETFGTRHPVPSLSKDDPNFREDGGYWLGSVWPPIEYMVCRGLRDRGHRALAREIAKKHLACQTELLGTKDYDSIWECYSPELKRPARNKRGDWVRREFVGWSGIGPFVLLVEDVLGLDIVALEKKVTWHVTELGRQGLTGIPFNGGTVDLSADAKDAKTVTVDVKSDRAFTLEVIAPDGVTRQTIDIKGEQK